MLRRASQVSAGEEREPKKVRAKGAQAKGARAKGRKPQKSVGMNSYAVGRNAQSRPSPGQDFSFLPFTLFRRRSKLGVCAPQCRSLLPRLARFLSCPVLILPGSYPARFLSCPAPILPAKEAQGFTPTPLQLHALSVSGPHCMTSVLNASRKSGQRYRPRRSAPSGHPTNFRRLTVP